MLQPYTEVTAVVLISLVYSQVDAAI